MNREDIIRMAREAHRELVTKDYPGHAGQLDPWTMRLLERFAALVEAQEREKVAAWMMQRGLATGHGETVEEMLGEMQWQVAEAEREACALVCDDYGNRDGHGGIGFMCAEAIRARGEK